MSARFGPSDQVIQCAANISEGRRLHVIARIVEASLDPATVAADVSSDPDHNRTVISWLGSADGLERSVLAGATCAASLLDLTLHRGVHPRMGVVDVVPFTPIRNADMATCAALAIRVARALSEAVGLAVYLYEEAAAQGRPRTLPHIRRAAAGWPADGALEPDFAPDRHDPRLGAAVVGARMPLVAYNVVLEAGDHEAARRIAADIRRLRDVRPDLCGVRALGLYLASARAAQVSMNLTQPHRTPLTAVYRAVGELAQTYGARAGNSEIVGLIPAQCLGDATPEELRLTGFRPEQVIEYWLA